MPSTMRLAALPLALVASLTMGTPAQADSSGVSMQRIGCDTFLFTNTNTSGHLVLDGDGWGTYTNEISPGTTRYWLSAGDYTWRVHDIVTGRGLAHGRFTVGRCPNPHGSAQKVDGDENRDGRADVLALRRDGKLFYYRNTGAGLAPAVQVGSGMSNVTWMKRITTDNGEGPNLLLTRRSDGTLWSQVGSGNGHYGAPRQVASGLDGYDLDVTPTSYSSSAGYHVLTANRGTTQKTWLIDGFELVNPSTTTVPAARQHLWMHDVDGDGWGDRLAVSSSGTLTATLTPWTGPSTTRVMGRGWSSMSLVSSVGNVSGDKLPDLLARRTDGTLWVYPNVAASSGTRAFSTPRRLGTGWNGFTLVG